jgi:hypothetical protein
MFLENKEGCHSVSDTFDIIVNKLPVINLGKDTSININQNLTLNAGNAKSYLWSTGEQTQTIKINGNIGIGDYKYSVQITDEKGCKNSDTIAVKIASPLGFDENALKFKTIVFPNPSTDYLYIEFDDGISGDITLELINASGKQVLARNISIRLSNQKEKLDLAGFSKGTYYLKVIMDKQVAIYKVIIN